MSAPERVWHFRIEAVSAEARQSGYGPGWHVFDEREPGGYVGTFETRAEARAYVRQARLAETAVAP